MHARSSPIDSSRLHGASALSRRNYWKLLSLVLVGLIVFHFLTSPGVTPSPSGNNAAHLSVNEGHLWWQKHVRDLADPEPVQIALPPSVKSMRALESVAKNEQLSFEQREAVRAAHQRIVGAAAFAKWRVGTDFFADYSVSDIRPPSAWTKPGPVEFSYVNESTSPYFIRWVSEKPRIAVVPEFLSDEECDAVVAAAEKKLFRSQVAVRLNEKHASPINDVRTSSQAWLDINQEPARAVTERIFALTGFVKQQAEQLQVLRYDIGQKYDAHEDYFDPRFYGAQTSNRALTAYLYLSDVEEGGHTWFPMANGGPRPRSYTSCDVGFGFKPHKRTVVLFYDAFPDRQLDPASIHGSCPVKRGLKWGGTLWLRIPT